MLVLLTVLARLACAQSLLKLQIPDLQVVDQSGRQLRFSSEIVGEKVTVISAFFSSCASICPITQENLSRLAQSLGDRLGRDVVLISISVDPLNDTPERMKIWGEKFHVGPGWILLSGTKTGTEQLLKALGLFAPGFQRHQ